jgi:hypothetical protein
MVLRSRGVRAAIRGRPALGGALSLTRMDAVFNRHHEQTWLGMLAAMLLAVPAVAGPYSRLQVLLPGESAAPGTSSGRNGSPRAQTAGVPFTIMVRACDDTWNTVGTVTDAIEILASDASATLPLTQQLQAGSAAFDITLNAAGTFTVYGHDATDTTIPDGTSSPVTVLVLQGFEFSRITQKNQYAGTPMSITLTAVDPSGSVVRGYSGSVRLKEVTSFGDGRVEPAQITLSSGSWTGSVTMYRADETSINRGNVNLYADLLGAPFKNGTSDPFTVHPSAFSRLQVVVPGETPLPGSSSGRIGAPATQSAGRAFTVDVYSTDAYWNPVPSVDAVRIVSSDPAASTPVSGNLQNGVRQFSLSLGTTGSQTLSVNDQTNGSVQGMTSAAIPVIPSAADHFVFAPIGGPVTAGVPVAVTIAAADTRGNTLPDYSGEAILSANTGAGSISPELVTFAGGSWSGNVVLRGAGGSVSLTCADFASPPHTGTSGGFVVTPGPMAGLQVLLPGEAPQGGTADGKSGTPQDQVAGTGFVLTLRAVDAYWNLVSGVVDRVALGSTDAFATMPAETTLANGQLLVPVKLYRSGAQRIWASDIGQPAARADTSSAVQVAGGPFARVLVLAPGESPAPGTASGRTGTATDQSINYTFTVTALSTDAWWNPVHGVTDVVRLASTDPMAVLPPDTPLVDGRAELAVRLSTGGFQQISISDLTDAAKTGGSTQVRAITSGFHLEAAVSPGRARAGEPFTLLVKVTNDAGSVIQEINSFVTIEVLNASTRQPGQGALLTTRFQLLQGQRAISETYTYAEPVVLIARDDAGNAPGITDALVIDPGVPAAIRLSSNPPWVHGNSHATVSARLVDAFENGVPGQPLSFELLSGTGTLAAIDTLTGESGLATADFLSSRQPEVDRLQARAGEIVAILDLETAFVDPNAAGGTIASYPNPFHPAESPVTIAYKLDDAATVSLRIFTLSGDLVKRADFPRGAPGGAAGLNTFVWNGQNGKGKVVASGGYIVHIEAQGEGETLHVMRRKIAVVQ